MAATRLGYRSFGFLLPFVLLCSVSGRLPDFHNDRITQEDGLSHATVYGIVQDDRGFIWFAAQNGMNRYDGYQIRTYPTDSQNPSRPAIDSVSVMLKDDDGKIWVGTWGGGLELLDTRNETFVNFHHIEGDQNSLGNDYIQSLAKDSAGQILVGTNGGGLFKFNPETGHFRPVPLGNNLEHRVWSIVCEAGGRTWVATSNGLFTFGPDELKQDVYTTSLDDPFSLPNSEVRCLTLDNWGRLWMGTRSGVAIFDRQNNRFVRLAESPDQEPLLAGNVINTIFKDPSGKIMIGALNGLILVEDPFPSMDSGVIRTKNLLDDVEVRGIFVDRSGLIWVGSRNEGVFKIKPVAFRHYYHRPNDLDSLSSDFVWQIFQDRDGQTWFGTRDGLNLWHRRDDSFRHWRNDPNDPYSLSNNAVRTIAQDHEGALWLGTYNGGLNKFDFQNNRFYHFRHDDRDANSLADDDVLTILVDHQQVLWVGTRIGLSRYRPETGDFANYFSDPHNPETLTHNDIRAMLDDSKGRLWLATKGGLNLFDRDSGKVRQFRADPKNPKGLSHNETWCLYEDRAGSLWIGTDLGLNLYRPDGTFSVYTRENGLASNLIYSILGDGRNLWLSTALGLSRFDPISGRVRNFDSGHGLQGTQYNANSAFRAPDGEMLFGGTRGFNTFFPDQISENSQPPPVVFSGFTSLATGREIENIATRELIEMDYEHALFSLSFAALDFQNPAKNRYAYKWSDQDQWTQLDTRPTVNFPKLAPGDYRIQVKAANSDGFWNEKGAELRILVHPPWYKTIWAYCLYAVSAILLLLYYNKRQHFRFELERKAGERERMTARRLRQLDKMKDQFLANTSHELRTPLNGIIGLTESLLDGAAGPLNEKLEKNLSMIATSGRRLAGLVNDILDFSVLEKQELILNTQAAGLYEQVEEVVTFSKTLLGNKPIGLENRVNPNLPTVLADENRLQQILFNLVGNAIKFTESGTVIIDAEREGDYILVHVTDTGIGINPEHQDRIFESFQQADGNTARLFGGTGLGLSISRKLVELHGGSLKVNSLPGKGSTFTFSLPISGRAVEAPVSGKLSFKMESLHVETEFSSEPETIRESGAVVLIVDDDPVNRRVLLNILENEPYRTIEAENGPSALKIIESGRQVDLVLLDLMMPGLSGYDVCSRIRETRSLRVLPIIFLTARDRIEDMVRGFQCGANDYLGKPVSKHELMARIKIHLELLELSHEMEARVIERTRELETQTNEVIRAQEQMIMQEKMASLGTLTAGVAHEINNPTNFAHGSVQNLETDLEGFRDFLLEAAGDEADPQVIDLLNERVDRLKAHTDIIQEGTRRIRDIVRDLHNFSRLDQSTLKRAELTENLKSTLNLVRSRYNDQVVFETRFHDKLEMECLPAELNQVFMNLIVNGCQSIVEKQEMGAAKPGLLLVETRCEDEEAMISFTDNGKGIPSNIIPRIFEPFFTTKPVGLGTGLGLSISMGIIKKHGGTIEVDSDETGSSFSIKLPLNKTIEHLEARGIHGTI